MDVIEEGESNNHGVQSGESSEDDKKSENVEVTMPNNTGAGRSAPLEVLNHVTMNNPVETPRSTIKGFLNVPKQTELNFNRENLRKVEAQLKRAFVEFYQKLRLLKSFR